MRLLAAGAEGEQDGRGRLSLLIGFWDQLNFGQDRRGETFDFEIALGPVELYARWKEEDFHF